MNEEEFRLHDQIEDDHWWFAGKRLILRRLLERHAIVPDRTPRLLDLGCGTGGVLRDHAHELACFGSDRSPLALRLCQKKGFDRLVRADLQQLPFREGAFDTVLALDVIEHLDDDVGFLRDASALCAPGGCMIVAVPAFPILWSQHDVTFEHRRRYRARGLADVVRAAGLEPIRLTYTNAAVFPVAAVWRILSRTTGLGRVAPRTDFWPVPRWLNALLVRIYDLEARWLARGNLPFGVSAVCVARKPA